MYCDRTALDLITQTKDLKVPIEKADNDVLGGIGKIQSLLKKVNLHIDKNCHNLIREIQAYRRKKDKTNSNYTEEPVKQDDHAPDALRYGLTGFRAFKKKPIIGWVKRDLWDF